MEIFGIYATASVYDQFLQIAMLRINSRQIQVRGLAFSSEFYPEVSAFRHFCDGSIGWLTVRAYDRLRFDPGAHCRGDRSAFSIWKPLLKNEVVAVNCRQHRNLFLAQSP